MTVVDQRRAYADPAEQAGERAQQHAQAARGALHDADDLRAVAQALLALEARVEELCCYVARLDDPRGGTGGTWARTGTEGDPTLT
jgi:hypothetical protein